MCVGVECIEVNDIDRERIVPQSRQRALAAIDIATAEHHGARRRADQSAHDGQADVAGAAEQHDGLGFAECVLHRSQIKPEPAAEIALPHAERVDLVANRLPLVESGIAAPHCLWGHVRILGEIVPATRIQHHPIEAVQQIAEAVRRAGDVERQRPSGLRKAQRRRVGGTETLQHGEEARRPACREALDDSTHRVLLSEGHDELVLDHAALAVQAVPRSDEVQRMEEGADALDLRRPDSSATCGTTLR